MKVIKRFGLIAVLLIFISACKEETKEPLNKESGTTAVANTVFEIKGTTATITFPQFQVDETFVSDTIMHWKIVDEKGGIREADERISYKKLNDNQFFISWIEETGLTVSQVVDPKNETVVSFVSHADENNPRGKRSANFFEGTFKVKK